MENFKIILSKEVAPGVSDSLLRYNQTNEVPVK
jgi:hypothetical protein